MRRQVTLIAALGLAVAACGSGTSPAASPPPTGTTPPAPSPVATTSAPAASAGPTAPTLTVVVGFDGRTCTYTGPTVVPRGTSMTFRLMNTPAALKSSAASLYVVHARDGTTWGQVSSPGIVTDVPAWVDLNDYVVLGPDVAAAGATTTWAMTGDLYAVICVIEVTGRVYAGALIQVLDS